MEQWHAKEEDNETKDAELPLIFTSGDFSEVFQLLQLWAFFYPKKKKKKKNMQREKSSELNRELITQTAENISTMENTKHV